MNSPVKFQPVVLQSVTEQMVVSSGRAKLGRWAERTVRVTEVITQISGSLEQVEEQRNER